MRHTTERRIIARACGQRARLSMLRQLRQRGQRRHERGAREELRGGRAAHTHTRRRRCAKAKKARALLVSSLVTAPHATTRVRGTARPARLRRRACSWLCTQNSQASTCGGAAASEGKPPLFRKNGPTKRRRRCACVCTRIRACSCCQGRARSLTHARCRATRLEQEREGDPQRASVDDAHAVIHALQRRPGRKHHAARRRRLLLRLPAGAAAAV
jgi:hypothetical protein